LGNLRTLLHNALFIVLFYFGVSPRTLHRSYYGERLDGRRPASRRTAECSHPE
jgi:hypothetical protein